MDLSTIVILFSLCMIALMTYNMYRKVKYVKENYRAPSEVVTRLKCKCGHTKIKPFFPYEYVGKQATIRCRKCAIFMYIDAIYIEYHKSIAQEKWEAEIDKWR